MSTELGFFFCLSQSVFGKLADPKDYVTAAKSGADKLNYHLLLYMYGLLLVYIIWAQKYKYNINFSFALGKIQVWKVHGGSENGCRWLRFICRLSRYNLDRKEARDNERRGQGRVWRWGPVWGPRLPLWQHFPVLWQFHAHCQAAGKHHLATPTG